jgi:hypothetical protein
MSLTELLPDIRMLARADELRLILFKEDVYADKS